jgi:hypothetical protein
MAVSLFIKLALDAPQYRPVVQKGDHSDRNACSTSTREARAAGINDAPIAAPMSTTADPTVEMRQGVAR